MKKLSVYYFNPENIENFGDIINPHILSLFTSREIVRENINRAEMLAIGSILQELAKENHSIKDVIRKRSRSKIHVWGTGMISPMQKDVFFRRRMQIHALRGKHTLEHIRRYTRQDLSDIPLGDPGLLVSRLLLDMPEKEYKIGIVPHYVDQDSPIIESLREAIPSSRIISILGDPLETVNQIAKCEIVLSSAMHGLIAADSLNIPNRWIQISDRLTGGHFKFHDYYSVFGIVPEPWDLRKRRMTMEDIRALPSLYPITPDQVLKIQNDLVRSFPFKDENTFRLS